MGACASTVHGQRSPPSGEPSHSYQNPYIEQQLPFFQFPQMVSPFDVPQVPSVVTRAVALTPGGMVELTGPMTGSPVVVGEAPPLQPFWQPFETRQCPSVDPQYLRRRRSVNVGFGDTVKMPVARAAASKWSFGSQVTPPAFDPHFPLLLGGAPDATDDLDDSILLMEDNLGVGLRRNELEDLGAGLEVDVLKEESSLLESLAQPFWPPFGTRQ